MKNSAADSPKSDTRASEAHVGTRASSPQTQGRQGCLRSDEACAAAVNELKASRVLIDALESENAALKTRLETEKRAAQMLEELNATRKSEADALRKALDAKKETIAAKDDVIVAQEKLIELLKRKKSSPWKRVMDVLVGVGVAVILK